MKPFVAVTVISVCLAALAFAQEVSETCAEGAESCRETCTLQYGTDVTQGDALNICMHRCNSDLNVCTKRTAQASQKPPAAPAATAPRHVPAAKDPAPELVIQAKPTLTTPEPATTPTTTKATSKPKADKKKSSASRTDLSEWEPGVVNH